MSRKISIIAWVYYNHGMSNHDRCH